MSRRFDQPIYYWTNFPPSELVTWLRFRIGRGEPDALAVPLQGLESGDIDWVHRAVLVLGELGDARAVEPLIATVERHARAVHGRYTMTQNTLQPCNPGDVVFSGIQALGKLADTRAVPVLVTVLGKTDFIISAAAARALGDLGDPRAVEPLVSRLQRSLAARRAGTREDRQAAGVAAKDIIGALAKIGHPAAVGPLTGTLGRAEPQVITWVADALGRIGDMRAAAPLLSLLLGGDPQHPGGSGRLPGGALMAVATALARLGDRQQVEPLIGALNRPQETEVRAAARVLGHLGDRRAVEPLIAVLEGPYGREVRGEAVIALGQLGDSRAVESLIGALTGAGHQIADEMFRDDVATALGALGDRRAVEPLLVVLADRLAVDPHLARLGNSPAKVIAALGGLGDRRAVPPLVTVLKGDDRYHRRDAAGALGRIGGTEAAAALLESIRTEPRLRDDTVRALENTLRDKDRMPDAGVLREILGLPDSLKVAPWTWDERVSTVTLAPLKDRAAAELNRLQA